MNNDLNPQETMPVDGTSIPASSVPSALPLLPVVEGRVAMVGQQEVVWVGDLAIPVLGVANCTGRPLPENDDTAKRIQRFIKDNG